MDFLAYLASNPMHPPGWVLTADRILGLVETARLPGFGTNGTSNMNWDTPDGQGRFAGFVYVQSDQTIADVQDDNSVAKVSILYTQMGRSSWVDAEIVQRYDGWNGH